MQRHYPHPQAEPDVTASPATATAKPTERLHTITLCRMHYDPRTRAYVTRRITEGRTKKDIIRCLKRYVARDIYAALTTP